jgi:DNA-binding NtrC family response regulator
MVTEGTFREDLYYRLSTFPIHLPPLRERQDDIALLATALLERVAPQRKLSISTPALRLLQAQSYPGNVRELRNLLERTALLCDGDTVEVGHVQQALASGRRPAAGPRAHPQVPVVVPVVDARASSMADLALNPGTLKTLERAALQQLVAGHQGSRVELAEKLGISQRSLYRKLKALE